MSESEKKVQLTSFEELEKEKIAEMRERTPQERLRYLFYLQAHTWNPEARDPEDDEKEYIELPPKK
jgi:hypothetical protein